MIKRKSAIQAIDVRDLPATAITALQLMVQALRHKNAEVQQPHPGATSEGLLQKPGGVKGKLTRAEIYDDVV